MVRHTHFHTGLKTEWGINGRFSAELQIGNMEVERYSQKKNKCRQDGLLETQHTHIELHRFVMRSRSL